MCEYLERMSIKGTATEDIRSWSGYAHRVVELTGPSPTMDDVSVYLWLHKDSALLLLDMCDEIDSRFDALQAENGKLREALRAAWKCAHAGISCSDCRLIAGGCTLQTAMRELGMEVPE